MLKGIGIPSAQQLLIFQEFSQSSGQGGRKYGGTGLGLSISQRLVEMMGGTLSLSSQLEKGSSFTIKLTGVDIADVSANLKDNEEEPSAQNSITFSPASILVVDDVEDNRELLLANFADSKLQISIAKNGLEALNLAKQQTFDLILMDIRMPIMGGYEAAEKIKQFSSTPIIALTASVMVDQFEHLKSEHFDGFLRKPVLKKDLIKTLSRFLAFEYLHVEDKHEGIIQFSNEEYKILAIVIDKLEQLASQYTDLSEHNNLSDISLFAEKIKAITDRYPLKVVEKYAQQLMTHAANFDIPAIKRSLNSYPDLLAALKKAAPNTSQQ